MMGIIDRFEGDFTVVEFEGRKMVNIHNCDLPAGLKEGDVIQCSDGEFVFDKVATEQLKKETKAMFDKLWE